MPVRDHIRFWLNDALVTLGDVGADKTLLDFLRLDRGLVGTKEGCAEGDCGACTVLVGRLSGGELVYESVNACIRFLGSLDGCHVVTVEHLSAPGAPLHPVQRAMVEHHASQCGFCTPGFVMALYALWMRNPEPGPAAIEEALQGNLCRCTGYAPILRAAMAISGHGAPAADPLVVHRAEMAERLAALADGARVEIATSDSHLILPASADDLARVLETYPDATLVAGATDVGLWVTKSMRDISPAVFIGHLDELRAIKTTGEAITFGAAVSYSQATPVIAGRIPKMAPFWSRIGGEQVRNMGTIGGNIANGSPIGDTPPPFIALGATLTLRQGDARRTVRLEDFFIAYGKQDRAPGEFVESVSVPLPGADDLFAVHKVSKRRDEDISSVCGAFRLTLDAGTVSAAVIAFGGMAATPKRANAVEAALVGKPFTEPTVAAAMEKFADDFSPLTDWRASSGYRLAVARNLLRRVFLEHAGAPVRLVRREVA
ncbi:MAG TPA: xanthine dehydrogenase small subunit [Devosiaceae bacterium]|nr:xanthine dehydrogenase small subunit [Devosiaceae bacterium]